MTTKKEFLLEKLGNLIKYVRDKVPESEMKLVHYSNNYEDFLKLLIGMNIFADKNCDIHENNLSAGLKIANIEFEKLDNDVKEKLKKYLKCFITILRS